MGVLKMSWDFIHSCDNWQ